MNSGLNDFVQEHTIDWHFVVNTALNDFSLFFKNDHVLMKFLFKYCKDQIWIDLRKDTWVKKKESM